MGILSEARRPGSRVLVLGAFTLTVLVHGGILVAAWISNAHAGAPPLAQMGPVIEVQAVRFGKPRDMSFLPHKAAAPKRQPTPKIALTNNEKALPKLKDPNKPEEKTQDDLLKKTHENLFKDLPDDENENNTGSVAPEGDPNGVKGGSATQGKGPIYLQHLVAAVQNAWEVPTTIPDEQLKKLVGIVYFKIDESGNVSDLKLQQSSGNPSFDSTLLAAFASIKKFDPPDAEVRSMLAEGVALRFKYEKAQ